MAEWISTMDRLPEIGERVLVCTMPGSVDLGMRVQGMVFVNSAIGGSIYTVTHWMPLPEPPEATP